MWWQKQWGYHWVSYKRLCDCSGVVECPYYPTPHWILKHLCSFAICHPPVLLGQCLQRKLFQRQPLLYMVDKVISWQQTTLLGNKLKYIPDVFGLCAFLHKTRFINTWCAILEVEEHKQPEQKPDLNEHRLVPKLLLKVSTRNMNRGYYKRKLGPHMRNGLFDKHILLAL